MPDASRIVPLLRKAATLLRGTPGRHGSVVALGPEATEVLVVGDLHGNLAGAKTLLKLAALEKHPGRHLVLQELIHGPEDNEYPDNGGDRSHQLVDVVAALKCQYPDRVHVILGNHELAEITGRIITKNGRALNREFRRGVDTYYGSGGADVYAAYRELFLAMPLAVRTHNRIFICHTIPDGPTLEDLDLEVLRTGVWSEVSMARRGTVYNLTWGRDVEPATADRFAELVDADLFINGHQPCPEQGYWIPNHRQLIIDGTGMAPTFCLAPADRPITLDHLRAGIRKAGDLDE